MKLLFCKNCSDIFKLTREEARKCKCGKAWGQYSNNDGWHAIYGGSGAVPLLLNNPDIIQLLSGSITTAGITKAPEGHPRFIHVNKAPKIRCKKCRTVIYSLYRHDFNTCKCGAVSIDGGFDYRRIVGTHYEEVKRSTFNGHRKKKD